MWALVYSRPHVLLTIDGTPAGQFMCAEVEFASRKLSFFTNEVGNSSVMLSAGCVLLAKPCQQKRGAVVSFENLI